MHTQGNMPFIVPKFAIKWFKGKPDAKAVDNIMKANSGKNNTIFHKAFRVACKNCYVGGLGCWAHSIQQCMQKGNKCFLPCLKCGGSHWTNNCPVKKVKKE